MSALLTCAFCLLPSALTATQAVRDSSAPAVASGTASLSGVLVTDEQTPQPIPRARVELTAEGEKARTTYTDPSGAFAFNNLPAGRYSLVAIKPAYVRATYGAKRPGRPGTPITIANGQRVVNLRLRMARGSVITGTVRDELGQPAPGASVRVLQYRMQNGERTLGPVPLTTSPLGETTDDRGIYRIYGLPAGDYIVAATPRPLGPGEIRQITPAELEAVERAAQQRLSTQAANQPAPAPTVTYAQVFYPGTTSAANATTLTIGASEERGGIDFSLPLVRTARVEGTITGPPGVSVTGAVLLLLSSGVTIPGSGFVPFNRARPDAEGRFSFSGVAPGAYRITAQIPDGGLWAAADLTVDGENLDGIRLELAPGLTVGGRVTVDPAASAAAPDLSTARISLQPSGSALMTVRIGTNSDSSVDSGGHFTLTNVTPGKYRLDAQLVGAGRDWKLKSAIVAGKDVLDVPLEIGPNDRINDAVLTFTTQTQEVAGTLQDASGRPAPDFTVVVFPADKTLWPSARRIKTSRPGTDGRFVFRDLPAGEYRIAALIDIAPGEANDPDLLQELVPASIAFSLHDGEKKTQDIRMAGG